MNSRLDPDPRIHRAVVFLAGLIALIAVASMTGWVLHIPALVRVAHNSPPIYFNSALGLLSAATALYGVASGRRGLVMPGAVLAMLLGGVTLVEYLAGANPGLDTFFVDPVLPGLDAPFPGRMPGSSAVSLVLAAAALLAVHLERARSTGHMIAGTFGATVAALAIAVLMSYATGLLSSLRTGVIAALSIQDCVAFIALGLGLMVASWRRDTAVSMLPDWGPYGVGLAVLVTTVVVWGALDTTERQHLNSELGTVTDVTRRRMGADLEAIVQTLRRRGAWAAELEGEPAPAIPAWQRNSDREVADTRGLRALVWLDSAMQIRGAARADAVPGPGTERLERALRAALPGWANAKNPRGLFSVLGRDDRGASLLALTVPNCGALRCSGFTAGILQTDSLFARSLEGIAARYAVVLTAAGQPVYRSATPPYRPAEWNVVRSFSMAALPWRVEVSPSHDSVQAFRSDLPIVVAVLGTAVAVLLTMTLRLLQNSHATARAAERGRLARAVESATDGLWERNPRTGETSRSAAVWRRLGYDPEAVDATGSPVSWESLIHPEDQPLFDTRMKQHLIGATEAFEVEYRVKARDGDWHWIVDRGRVVERDDRSRAVRMVGICADVTERKRSDQALAASERRFRTMFDSGFQLQHLLDVNCKLLEANRTSLSFAGVSLDEVRGRFFWDTPWWTGQEAGQGRLRKACEDALLGKTVRYQEEVRGADGRVTLMDFSLTPIIDSQQRVIQLLAEGRDISERQRVENTLRELDTLSTMGRLAARVAHEINNPLAGIQNSFLLVKGAIPADHPYFAYVGAIEREIARMAGITRQLYETYRPEGDGREEASIPILISDAVTMLQQVNRASKVRIEVDTSGAPSVLQLPGALLRQAVYHLVQNAVEASPTGGTVWVKAWRADHTFWLTVTDQGPGVPADIRARGFEPFVTTKSGIRTGGIGLGLSLVQRSILALGGRIDLRDPENGGAEFRIAIPLK